MREISTELITERVAALCRQAATELPADVEKALRKAKDQEQSALAVDVLEQILENAEIARTERLPLCQDTGITVIYAEIGQDAHVTGGDLNEAIQAGVSKGYTEGHLRASVIFRPFGGRNTGNNTPAIVHYEVVPGDKLKFTVLPKGMGCENTSRIKMVKPSEGWSGVKDFVIETVKHAGPNACPPLIVGVGVGGTFDYCAHLAKKAVMLELGVRNADPDIAKLEEELEDKVRELHIGPQGLGGMTTALGIHMIVHPCHIASVPVAVNIQCHSARQKSAVI